METVTAVFLMFLGVTSLPALPKTNRNGLCYEIRRHLHILEIPHLLPRGPESFMLSMLAEDSQVTPAVFLLQATKPQLGILPLPHHLNGDFGVNVYFIYILQMTE